MPFIVVLVGLVLIVSGARNKQNDLYNLLKSDLTGGKGSFLPWLLALFVVGGLGYIRPLKPISDAFLLLIVIVLILSNGGFFQKFTQQTGI